MKKLKTTNGGRKPSIAGEAGGIDESSNEEGDQLLGHPRLILGLLLATLYYISSSQRSSVAEPGKDKVVSVKASEIGKSVELIGRLGTPMTEVVDIEGYWIDRGFKRGFVFGVTSVDGQRRNPPVEFSLVRFGGQEGPSYKEIKVGEMWSSTAVELGHFHGVIEGHWELFYDRGPVAPANLGPGPFVSELVIAKKTLIKTKLN